MQAGCLGHTAGPVAHVCPGGTVKSQQKSSRVGKAASALRAGGRRRGLLQQSTPEQEVPERSCLRLGKRCQTLSQPAQCRVLSSALPLHCQAENLSPRAIQELEHQSSQLTSEPDHGDVSGQCWRLPGGLRWRHLALALVALLLLVWRRPAPALAEAAAEGGNGGAAFNFGAFGLRGSLTDRTPGLAYFALLMAAGCGLFVSEEALNVWVGGSLGRCLVLNGSREALLQSLRSSGGYIASVIFWVYWGVCLSDLIPFYAGRWASQRGESVKEKLGGTNQATLARVTSTVRKYGRYIGFVERFSLGVRNPTAFLAGFSGVSTPTFFAGVCAGGLITLPLQMGLGFALRDRPVAALATVAAVVGTWTIIPYASAAFAAAWFFVKQRLDKQRDVSSNT